LNSSRKFERSRIGFDGRFDYDSTRTSEEQTSGIVQVDKCRSRVFARPKWDYALTQRTDLNAVVSYESVSYDDVDVIPLFNYTNVGGSAGIGYRLTERLNLFTNLSFDRYEANSVDQTTETYAGVVGAGYAVSPTLKIQGAVGGRDSRSESPAAGGGTITEDTTGVVYVASLSKDFVRGRLRFEAERGLVPTGRGELLDTTSLTLGLDYPVTPRWTMVFDARAYRNREPGGEETANDRDFIRAEPQLVYRLTPDIDVAFAYRYRFQDRDVVDGSATSNAVFLTLSYGGRRMPMDDFSLFD
jgi:hypothetical protein